MDINSNTDENHSPGTVDRKRACYYSRVPQPFQEVPL